MSLALRESEEETLHRISSVASEAMPCDTCLACRADEWPADDCART
jgi:hypothetical protein